MLETLILILIIQIIFFIGASWLKTDKFTDLSYGLSFVILALYLLMNGGNPLLLILPIIWGLRISGYLFVRILKIKNDKRFDGIRENFWAFAKFWFLQAISIYLISLPFIIYSLNETVKNNWFFIALFLIGLTIESVADHQKYQFKNKKENQNKFIQTGLWKYSRHPNYFGEMLVWWSIYGFCFVSLSSWQHLALISPIYITFLLIFGTGIPTLEKNYNKKYGEAWEKYKKKTSPVIPWFPAS